MMLRMSDRRQNSSSLSLGIFHNVPKKKRGQTLLRLGQKRPARLQWYGSIDFKFLTRGVVEELTRANGSVPDLKRLHLLSEVASKELKKVIRNKMKTHNKSAELPAHLRELVERKGGSNLKLVITKVMYTTDLNEKNSRFQMPVKKIVCPDFLSQEEKETLKQIHDQNKKGTKKEGMDVKILIEPSMEEHNLKLREWPMKNNNNYVLVSGWNSAIKNEKMSGAIKDGDTVQLWSFRCSDQLWFLLHKVDSSKHNSH